MKHNNDQPAPSGATYDSGGPAILIQNLSVNDPAVVAESRRWSTGRRGAAVGEDDMAGVDLSAFASQALVVGAHAIGIAGGVQDTFSLERLITDVGARTAESASNAVGMTTTVVNQATEAMQRASGDAKKAIAEASKEARQSFTDNVETTRRALVDEVHRLFGGDNPELAARLTPMLERFGHDLDARVAKQTSDLFITAAKQFDPDDPTSPMSKHTRELQKRQETLSATLDSNHRDLATKVDQLATAIQIKTATANTLKRTTLGGESYASQVHEVMERIAAGLGDEYTETGTISGGLSSRSKKGDAVLTINGGPARIVLEMTESKRSNWNDYLDEAERNRSATASLGLVREAARNDGSTIRCIGSRRIIMTFDPDTDDPDLLRAIVQLLRISATAASSRHDRDEIHTADEKIAEALGLLGKIDEIKKVAGTLRQNAGKIEQQSDDVKTALTRLLAQAQSALSVAADDAA